jgi:glutamate-1-semialdehyde aminotransferase
MDVRVLRHMRTFCDKCGVLLVFDSMLWGGRYALGGASEYYGVIPDLECFGKAFGNGEAVAFVVGNQALAEHGEIASGTFSGDVTGLSAVCEVLRAYTTEPVIETLWARGKQLHAGLSQVLPASFATLTAPTPLIGITFANPAHKTAFKDAMAERGVLMFPDWWMVCYAHTEEQIDRVIAAAEASCRTLNF